MCVTAEISHFETALTVQEVAVTLLGVVAAYDLALQPWLGVWFPFPVARHSRHSWPKRRAMQQQHGTSLVPVCALALRWLLLTFCGVVYLGFRAWLTADSGKATLEGSQLLRRAENPFARPFADASWSYVASLLYLQAFYGKLLLSLSGDLCCEYSYNCIPTINSLADPRNIGTVVFWVSLGWLLRWAVLHHACCWQAGPETTAQDAAGLVGVCDDDSVDGEHARKAAAVESRRGEEDTLARDLDVQADLDGAYALCALSWLVLPMVPASNLFFTVGTLVAERLLYMPSIGLVLLFAYGVVAVSKRSGYFGKVAVWSTFAILLAVSCERTLSRTEDWLDDEALYTSAVQVCPNSAKNRHQLGQIYMNQAADIKAAAQSFDHEDGGVGEVAAEEVSELTAKALHQFEEVQVRLQSNHTQSGYICVFFRILMSD